MLDAGNSVNRHHFVPKSRGGKESEFCHRICHDMVHRLWTEKELDLDFSDPAAIRADRHMATFIRWVRGKSPTFYVRSDESRVKRSRRR
jgi:hypothetical protein